MWVHGQAAKRPDMQGVVLVHMQRYYMNEASMRGWDAARG